MFYTKEIPNLGPIVLCVYGLKHSFSSVRKMCDQGYEVLFHSNSCEVKRVDSSKTIMKLFRTSTNVYVLDGGKQSFCMGKMDESWLWHRVLGHLSFDLFFMLSRKDVVEKFPKFQN